MRLHSAYFRAIDYRATRRKRDEKRKPLWNALRARRSADLNAFSLFPQIRRYCSASECTTHPSNPPSVPCAALRRSWMACSRRSDESSQNNARDDDPDRMGTGQRTDEHWQTKSGWGNAFCFLYINMFFLYYSFLFLGEIVNARTTLPFLPSHFCVLDDTIVRYISWSVLKLFFASIVRWILFGDELDRERSASSIPRELYGLH